jgi:Undecaprenyl-phosphate glucose phosphotransferase
LVGTVAPPAATQLYRDKLRTRVTRGKRFKALLQLSLIAVDLAMLVLAFALGYYARNNLPLPSLPVDDPPPIERYFPILVIHTLTIAFFFYLTRMYHMKRAISRIDIGYTIAQNVSIGTFLAIAIETLALKNSGLDLDYPRGVLVYAWVFSILLVVAGREVHRQFVVRMRKVGIGRDRVLVVGVNQIAYSIISQIQRSPQFGLEVVGAVDRALEDINEEKVAGLHVPFLGAVYDLTFLIDTFQIDEVIIALPDATRQELMEIVNLSQRGTVDIKIFPDNFSFITSGLTVDDLGGMPLLGVRDIALRGWKLSLKRALDIVGSFLGLVFLSPLMLLTAILIYFSDRGPVFFTQERVGLDGKAFQMIKFRTMRIGADKMGKWTTKNDPRKTRIGSLMRKTNWDEIPNLINVFFGQMSLVGPRPEQMQFVQEFRHTIPRYMERHREKAGMTGWAQVNGLRGDTSIEERLKYDLYYVENWSIWLDIKIILRTIAQTILFRSKNAY